MSLTTPGLPNAQEGFRTLRDLQGHTGFSHPRQPRHGCISAILRYLERSAKIVDRLLREGCLPSRAFLAAHARRPANVLPGRRRGERCAPEETPSSPTWRTPRWNEGHAARSAGSANRRAETHRRRLGDGPIRVADEARPGERLGDPWHARRLSGGRPETRRASAGRPHTPRRT
jgi:hypothetical protein